MARAREVEVELEARRVAAIDRARVARLERHSAVLARIRAQEASERIAKAEKAERRGEVAVARVVAAEELRVDEIVGRIKFSSSRVDAILRARAAVEVEMAKFRELQEIRRREETHWQAPASSYLPRGVASNSMWR